MGIAALNPSYTLHATEVEPWIDMGADDCPSALVYEFLQGAMASRAGCESFHRI